MAEKSNPYESPESLTPEYPLDVRVRRLLGIPCLVLAAMLMTAVLGIGGHMGWVLIRRANRGLPVPEEILWDGLRTLGAMTATALILAVIGYSLRRKPRRTSQPALGIIGAIYLLS